MPADFNYSGVAKMIDHSLLNPTLTWNDLEQGISLALAYDVASVCIMPYALKHCVQGLRGSTVRAPPLGFPTAAMPLLSSWLRSTKPSRIAARNSTSW